MKISFCTTCMNRLFHLKETMLLNIANSSSYPEREFVLLNYSSSDEMDQWVKDNLLEHIRSGLVAYYKHSGAKYYVSSHAKNMAHRQGTGDILCNIDADCFIEAGFCEHLLDLFIDEHGSQRRIICGSPSRDRHGFNGAHGKIAVWRDDFYAVNGYNEDIYLGWGCDDGDFRYRVGKHQQLLVHEFKPEWNHVIWHPDDLRVQNFQLKDITLGNSISLSIATEARDYCNYVTNSGREWGSGPLVRENFI